MVDSSGDTQLPSRERAGLALLADGILSSSHRFHEILDKAEREWKPYESILTAVRFSREHLIPAEGLGLSLSQLDVFRVKLVEDGRPPLVFLAEALESTLHYMDVVNRRGHK